MNPQKIKKKLSYASRS